MRVTAHPRYAEFKRWFRGRAAAARRFDAICFRVAGPRHTTAAEVVAGVGVRLAGGRWNPVGAMNVVYVSTDAVTAMAEALEHYRYYGLPVARAMPKVTVAVRVDVTSALDLTDRAVRATLPVTMAKLLGEDWRGAMAAGREAVTQAFGRAAFAAGFGGLIVPSKARRGGTNVVVFPGRLGATDALAVLSPDLLAKLGRRA